MLKGQCVCRCVSVRVCGCEGVGVHLCVCMAMCVLRQVRTCVHNKINYIHNFMICMDVASNQTKQCTYACVDKSLIIKL